MRLLILSQVRYLLRTPGSTIAAIVGVTLGVTSVVAVHLVGERINEELERASLLPGYSHVVEKRVEGRVEGNVEGSVEARDALDEDDYFDLREQWRLGALPDVRALVPVVDGHVVLPGGAVARLLAIDPLADPRGGTGVLHGLFDARILTSNAVIASSATNLRVGDTIELNGLEVEVIQISQGGIEEWLVADIGVAQEILGRGTGIESIWLRIDTVSSRILDWAERLLPGISAAFRRPPTVQILGGFRVREVASWDPTQRFAKAIVFNLGALGALALFVAGFLMYQSSYAGVARRRRDHTRLVALGLSRARIRALMSAEGALIGLFGAVIGVVLGWVFAQRLAYLPFGSVGAVMPDGVVLAKAILGGVGVGCVASYAACVAAERVDLLSKRRHGRPPTRVFPRMRVAVVLAAIAILVAGITVEGAGIAGAFAAVLALCICQVVLVLPAVTVGLERLFNRRRGKLLTTANLRSFVSKLSEIRIATAALSIAIAASVGISGMVENFRADFMQLLELRLWEGLYLEDAQDADIARISSLPGVIDVRRYARFNASSAGHRLSVSLANTDARETARYGYRGALTDGVMLSEVGERLFGLTVGDGIAIDGVEFAIRHVFKDYGAPSPRVIVPLELSGRLLGAGAGPVVFDRASVLTDPERLDSVRGAIAREFPNIRMRDQQEIRQFSVGVFDRTFKITSSLTLIALIVAVVGLYNALSALQLRRRGEFRLLHTLGLPRLALTSMAMSQSATIGVVAALSAIPLGLGISYLLCEFVNPRAFGWTITFTVNWTRLAEPVLLGIVAAILAGLIPAYNATRGMHAVSTYAFE